MCLWCCKPDDIITPCSKIYCSILKVVALTSSQSNDTVMTLHYEVIKQVGCPVVFPTSDMKCHVFINGMVCFAYSLMHFQDVRHSMFCRTWCHIFQNMAINLFICICIKRTNVPCLHIEHRIIMPSGIQRHEQHA